LRTFQQRKNTWTVLTAAFARGWRAFTLLYQKNVSSSAAARAWHRGNDAKSSTGDDIGFLLFRYFICLRCAVTGPLNTAPPTLRVVNACLRRHALFVRIMVRRRANHLPAVHLLYLPNLLAISSAIATLFHRHCRFASLRLAYLVTRRR